MRSGPMFALMLHQHWQVCTVWRCSHRSVYEDVTLWVEPGLVLGPTLPGLITPKMGGDTIVFVQHNQGMRLWFDSFFFF